MLRGIIFSLVFIVAVGTCAGIQLYSHLDVYDDVYIRHVSGRVRRSTTDSTTPQTSQMTETTTDASPTSTEAESVNTDAESAGDDTDSPEDDPESTGDSSESPDQDSSASDDTEGDEATFEFPERMTFTFTVRQRKVRLDLKLNEQQRAHVPVNLVTKTGIHRYHEDKQRDYAYYQVLGEETAAAVMVRCPDFTFPCHMTGQFRVGDETYLVEPNSDKPKLVSKMPHKVYKINQSGRGSYKGDTSVKRTEAQESTEQETDQRRSKRQAQGLTLTVELEMVVDYSLYSYWLGRHNGDAAQALSTIDEYYEQVANMMDLRFSSLATSPGDMTFDIVPLEINVVTDDTADTWISNNLRTNTDGETLLEASPALDQFETWAADNKAQLSKFDAIMAFTRRDLGQFSTDGTQSSSGTLGLARQWTDWQGRVLNGLCDNVNSQPAVSIVEDLSTGATPLTAAHELAHNMGADHDTEIAECSGLQDYIMDETQRSQVGSSRAANPWTFSSCSKATIQDTTNRLFASGETCLLTNTFDVTEFKRVQSSRLLGEIYSIEDQCVLKEGVGSQRCTFSWEGSADTICHNGIYCLVPGTNTCTLGSVMPGTPCGTGQCIQGTCQATTTAPPTTVTTPKITTTVKPTTTTKTTTTVKPTTTTKTTTTVKPTTTTKTTTTVKPTTTTKTTTTVKPTTTTKTTTTVKPTTTTKTTTTVKPTTTTKTTTTVKPTTTTKTTTTVKPTTTTKTTTTTTKPTTTTRTTTTTTQSPTTTATTTTTRRPGKCDWYCRWRQFLDYLKSRGWSVRGYDSVLDG